MRYLFGDTDIAAGRLRLLAELFAESSWRFVARSAEAAARLRLGVDLGCGGGHTSHLLARAAGCRRVVGLDLSQRFVRLARKTATSSVSFRRHDVTVTPFPLAAEMFPSLSKAYTLAYHIPYSSSVVWI